MKKNTIKFLSKFIMIFVLVLAVPINAMAASDEEAQRSACSEAYSKYKAQMNSNCNAIVYGNNASIYIKGVFSDVTSYSSLTSEQKQQYYNRCVSSDGIWGVNISNYIGPVNNQYSSKTGMTCTTNGTLSKGTPSSNSSTGSSQNSASQTTTGSVMYGSSGTVNQSIQSSSSGSTCSVTDIQAAINTARNCKNNITTTGNTTGLDDCLRKATNSFNSALDTYSSCEKNKCSEKNNSSTGYSACITDLNAKIERFKAHFSSAKESSNAAAGINYGTTGETASDMVDGKYELDYEGSPCNNERIALAVSVVGKVIDIVKIVVPILLVIMALVDITKAVISQDDSKMNKMMGHLVKRIISAVILFFIITIVQIVCGLIGNGSVDNNCLEIISSPWNTSTDVWDD